MRSNGGGGEPHAPPCARAPSVGFAATSPVKDGGGLIAALRLGAFRRVR